MCASTYGWLAAVGAIEMVLAVSSTMVAELPKEDTSEGHSEANKSFGFLCLTVCCLCMVGTRVEGLIRTYINVCTMYTAHE